MKSNDVIYVNGDSWCDNKFFKEVLHESFPDTLIINSAIQGNWNHQINKQTIKDVNTLYKTHENIHCFVFYSECLRGNEEIDIFANLKKNNIGKSPNFLMERLLETYHASLFNNIKHKCNLFLSTAFIDGCSLSNFDTMLESILENKTKEKCFSLSSYLRHNTFFKNNFSKQENIEMIESILSRCRTIENIPHMKNLHPNHEKNYFNIVKAMKKEIEKNENK